MTFDQTDLSTGPDPSWTEEERAAEAERLMCDCAMHGQERLDDGGLIVSVVRALREMEKDIQRGLDDVRADRTRPWSEIRPTVEESGEGDL